MKIEAIALLMGYLADQKEEIGKLFGEIKNTEPAGNVKTVYLGYFLHNLYCAFEDLFKEVARTFENQINDSSIYHRELLKRMTLEVPGIRPPFLSKESYKILDELRRFRHTFRHAYTYELDSTKVNDLKQKTLLVWDNIESDIRNFEQFLKDKMKE
ncbi:MAG: hypothetical protein QMC83_02675 [Thermodesulfovibrionales bacterium]|nr:hypothetical protein [Thermodesulfovibrionales bacterium]